MHGLKELWAIFQGGGFWGVPIGTDFKELWAIFQGGGKPRPYHDTTSQARRIMIGTTLAVALALKSAPMGVSPTSPSPVRPGGAE